MPEILQEYGTNFRALGFDGDEAFNLLVSAAGKGKFALDKTGDALKEFSIRGSDMSKSSTDVFKSIGLDAEDMANMIAMGGRDAQIALQDTAKGLLEIEMPADRANAAIALFGAPLEDMSVDQIPLFLESLTGAEDQMAGFAGSSEQMGETLKSGPGYALEQFKNTITGGLTDALADMATWVMNNADTLTTLAMVAAPFFGALAGYAATVKIIQIATVAWKRRPDDPQRHDDAEPHRPHRRRHRRTRRRSRAHRTKTNVVQTIWDTVWNAIKAAWDWVWGVLQAGFNGLMDAFGASATRSARSRTGSSPAGRRRRIVTGLPDGSAQPRPGCGTASRTRSRARSTGSSRPGTRSSSASPASRSARSSGTDSPWACLICRCSRQAVSLAAARTGCWGPGTPTSDSILGVDAYGIPTRWCRLGSSSSTRRRPREPATAAGDQRGLDAVRRVPARPHPRGVPIEPVRDRGGLAARCRRARALA
ncbi:hypothetical protein GS887_28170 [Rhodococcus hoagii]|nr:hypothetical protein [Prescottella equi]